MPAAVSTSAGSLALRATACVRLIIAAAIAAAVLATFFETASRTTVNPFNFFGYFTLQSNLIGCAVLIALVVVGPRTPRCDGFFAVARGCATAYLVVVGIVYAVLLAPLGAAGGVPVPWANTVLHIVVPLYFAADWLLAPDRQTLPWARFWVLLVYPLAWCIVVLIRGAADGWVPYPFLDPAGGYGRVAFFVALITVVVGIVGAAVWASARLHLPTRAKAVR